MLLPEQKVSVEDFLTALPTAGLASQRYRKKGGRRWGPFTHIEIVNVPGITIAIREKNGTSYDGTAALNTYAQFTIERNNMRITDSHREKLCEMIYFAFVEIRQLGSTGKAEQAADLADAFHNLPRSMWQEDFSLEYFRDAFLAPYQRKYPEERAWDYVARVQEILAMGEDFSTN